MFPDSWDLDNLITEIEKNSSKKENGRVIHGEHRWKKLQK